jgi:hypothetical protein
MDDLRDRMRTVETRLSNLERFQGWLIGLGMGAGAVLGLFADALRKKLGV